MPFTQAEQDGAEVPGFRDVRIWADVPAEEFKRSGFGPSPLTGRPVTLLTLSGGGSGGAFGAGLLTGWSRSGTRPEFDFVSGVSTGALIAPFAFLGSDYDDELTFLYTSGVTEGLAEQKPLLVGLLGSGLLRSEPLRRLVETYVTDDLLKRIAAENGRNRRLYVVTTNLDAQRPVIWDLGRIAAGNRPGALQLFRDVLVASASIPAAFEPVAIEVRSGSRSLQELHADGGPGTQVFTVPDSLLAGGAPQQLPKGTEVELYAIVNNALMPEFEVVPNTTLDVAQRALSTIIKSQTRVSIQATQAFAARSGVKFHLASIDEQIPYDPAKAFDTAYMRRLYRLGYERAVSGRLWDDGSAAQGSAILAQTP